MILHLDIDCYFCSAERTKDHTLLEIPIAVANISSLSIFGIEPTEQRRVDKGVIITSSYEARAQGVRTGMLAKEALAYCPKLKILSPDHTFYRQLSDKLYMLLQQYTPTIERFSIDEFFCDLHGVAGEPLRVAKEIKERVEKELGLPISIGISSAKWIAKLATSAAKPNGICYVPKEEIYAFIEHKPIESFPGIGRAMQQKLKNHCIQTLGEVLKVPHVFESWGQMKLYKRIIGEDEEGLDQTPKRKSMAVSRTFDVVYDREEIRRRILILCRHLCFSILKKGFDPTTYYLKVRYEYKDKKEHRITLHRTFSEHLLREVMLNIFDKVDVYTLRTID